MKKGKSKEKGSSFERLISKELSLWLTNNKRDDIFWRTHSSGALGTISKKQSQYGDIMSIDDLGKILTDNFNIECRHGKCIKVKDLIYQPTKSSMVQFLKEGIINANTSHRRPLWIFRENGKLIMVIMNLEDWLKYSKEPNNYDNKKVVIILPKEKVILISFEDWKNSINLLGENYV